MAEVVVQEGASARGERGGRGPNGLPAPPKDLLHHPRIRVQPTLRVPDSGQSTGRGEQSTPSEDRLP
eukprot:14776324-Alexandrium_andersonii.AAC.1